MAPFGAASDCYLEMPCYFVEFVTCTARCDGPLTLSAKFATSLRAGMKERLGHDTA